MNMPHSFIRIIFIAVFSFTFLSLSAQEVNAVTVEELQAQIQALQQQVADVLAKISATSAGNTVQATAGSGSQFIHTLSRGSTDAETAGEVTKLQFFLADYPNIYPEALITGYFGVLTERAVQRYQAAKGIVSSGTPQTTGYGVVGPRTRAFLNAELPAKNQNEVISVNRPVINSITPLSGLAGTQIIVTGSGFTATNTVHFGYGAIPFLKSDNGTHIVFTVPAVLNPACFYATPPCLSPSQLLRGGGHEIFVSNERGISNTVTFFVEENLRALETAHSGNITLNRPLTGGVIGSNIITVFGKGFVSLPQFNYVGLPAGVFASTTTTCLGLPCAFTNTVSITSTSTEGTYPISVVVSAGGMTSTTTFNLIIAPPIPFDFSLSVSRDIVVTQPFSGSITASNTISTTLSGGPAQKITFTQTGLPAGVTGNIPSCTPTCTSTNTLTIGSSAVPGTYSVTVNAVTASTTKSVTYSLTILPRPAFSFHLSSSGDIRIIKPASGTLSATNTISAVLDSGLTQNVSFTQSGFPSGASAGLLGSCFLSCTKTNTVTVSAITPEGTYPITVKSTAGSLTSTTIYNLIVLPYVPLSFDISVSGDITITRPVSGTASAGNEVSVDHRGGRTQQITFVQTGLPSGAGFSIGACVPTCTVTNTLTISSFTPTSDYSISLSAQGGGASATTTYILHVR